MHNINKIEMEEIPDLLIRDNGRIYNFLFEKEHFSHKNHWIWIVKDDHDFRKSWFRSSLVELGRVWFVITQNDVILCTVDS